tara:strand:- start:519 stop:2246 length:1728 start_codon:yes stop_codon:yes gene_type:complete
MDGYLKRTGRPDVNFWMEHVNAGIRFREKFACEKQWPTWRSYYRGQWRTGIMPVNLFFATIRTLVPRIYFRNPSVSVTPQMPGFEAAAFSQILERVDNKMLREMRVKKQIKKAVLDTVLKGTGFCKLGFGAQFQPTPDEGITGQPFTRNDERVEYRDRVYTNMPWFSRVDTGSIIYPDGLEQHEDARWMAHWVRRPVEDVKNDPRFKNTKDIGASVRLTPTSHAGVTEVQEMADLIEIRDKKTQTVFVIAPHTSDGGTVLFHGDDEFLDRGTFPLYPITFNDDDQVAWGIPDSVILEPFQLEANEIRTQYMKHRRLALVRLMYKRGTIAPEEIDKLFSEDVGAAVIVDGEMDDWDQTQATPIPQDLIEAMRETKADFRETVGFSRNQFGEFKPGSSDTTATEANIVRQASEIRVDERRDVIADVIVDAIEGEHQIVFNHWQQEQVIDVVGPGGVPIWLKFTGPQMRSGQYLTKVDPDSSIPETKQLREQKAVQLYGLLRTNPLIDPAKLTTYLLHELHGVQFDDMMRVLPAPEQSPSGPIGTKEFGNLVQGSQQRAAANPELLNKPLQAVNGSAA